MYKLIAHETKDGPTPFWGYTIHDPEGNEIGNITKAIITIDPENAVYPKMTFHRKFLNGEVPEEQITKDVNVNIEVKHTPL
jgi:hypothetical protein